MNKRLYFIKDNDNNIVFDIDSSKFFKINKAVSDTNENDLLQDKEFMNQLSNVKRIKITAPQKRDRLNKVTIIVTSNCNLKCRYCFAAYIERDKSHNISSDTCIKAFDKLLEQYSGGIDQIMFFGGEPLLAFKEIKNAIEYYEYKSSKLNLKPARYGIVTNGTIINDEIIDFLNTYKDKVNLTISIDGTKEINDFGRVDRQGNGVYEKVLKNIKEYKDKIKFRTSIEVTLNKNHVIQYKKGKAKEWMSELLDIGLYAITAGVVESKDELLGLSDEDKEVYEQLYGEIIDYFFEELAEGRVFLPSDIIEGMKVLRKSTYIPLSCSAGLNNLTIDDYGNILPCYTFSGEESYNMGSVTDTVLKEKYFNIQKEFTDHFYKKPKECSSCWIRNICNIWCRGLNNQSNQNPLTILKPRCWTGKILFERIIVNLVRLSSNKEKYNNFVNTIRQISKH